MNFHEVVYACCQNGSFALPETLFSRDAIPYASAYAIQVVCSGL